MSGQTVSANGLDPRAQAGPDPAASARVRHRSSASRSSALRHNPKVLFGFAIVVQLAVLIVVGAVVGAVAAATLSRLDTVRPGSDDWITLYLGSIAFIGLAGLADGAVLGGVQRDRAGHRGRGRARAPCSANRRPCGVLWRRVKPAAWRLIGYILLYGLAAVLAVALVMAIAFGAIGIPTGFRGAGLVFTIIVSIVGMLGVLLLAIWVGDQAHAGSLAAGARGGRDPRGRSPAPGGSRADGSGSRSASCS